MKQYQLNQEVGAPPLYAQIQEILTNEIHEGIYKVDDTIPTETQLQDMFGVSRMTVRQAIEGLVNAGLVVKERSKGTRVVEPKINESLNEITGFTEEMTRRNLNFKIHSIQVSIIHADENIAEALGIQMNQNVMKLERVYHVSGKPLAAMCSYLPASLQMSIDEQVYNGSLYAYLQKEKGIKISRVIETLEVGYADDILSNQLQVKKGEALLKRSKISFDQYGNKVEYVIANYHPNRYKYTVTFG